MPHFICNHYKIMLGVCSPCLVQKVHNLRILALDAGLQDRKQHCCNHSYISYSRRNGHYSLRTYRAGQNGDFVRYFSHNHGVSVNKDTLFQRCTVYCTVHNTLVLNCFKKKISLQNCSTVILKQTAAVFS